MVAAWDSGKRELDVSHPFRFAGSRRKCAWHCPWSRLVETLDDFRRVEQLVAPGRARPAEHPGLFQLVQADSAARWDTWRSSTTCLAVTDGWPIRQGARRLNWSEDPSAHASARRSRRGPGPDAGPLRTPRSRPGTEGPPRAPSHRGSTRPAVRRNSGCAGATADRTHRSAAEDDAKTGWARNLSGSGAFSASGNSAAAMASGTATSARS